MSEPREIELKFRIEAARGPEVLAWLSQGRRQVSARLVSIYFDTPGHALRNAGFALRLRTDGQTWTQTVKSAAARVGPGRGEWEWALSGSSPDIEAIRRTPAGAALRAGSRLRPQFMVTLTRQSVDLRSPDGVIEACFDDGVVEAGAAATPVHEIELELKSGRIETLFALARRLRETFGLDLSVVTKADRGFALAGEEGLTARGFRPPRLSAAMTAGEAFQAMARAALEQILWNAELVAADPSVEAIHQTRVGARRLRATLSTFKTVVEDARLVEVKAGLRALGDALDTARNLDVFVGAAWGRDAAHDDPRIEAARLAAHEKARSMLAGRAMGDRLLETLVWLETGPWTGTNAPGAKTRDRSVRRFAAKALERGRRRLLDKGARLERLGPDARHRIRIQAKGLRYAADVFDQIFDEHPRRAKRFLAALEDLQETLGEMNDIATARAMVTAFPGADGDLIQPGHRERDLLEAAAKAYRKFKNVRPYWS